MIRPNNKIIIIGTLPPPIGGVSIYNKRLFDYLQNEEGIEADFIDYKRNSIFEVLKAVIRHKIIYLNCSSSLFKFFIATLSALFNKKLLITFHGNIERHSNGVTPLNKLIIKFATMTIALNRQSFDYAAKYSGKVFLGTAFIPPMRKEELSDEIKTLLADCRKNYKVICSSNAHNVSIDKSGNEIYQVRFLLSIFSELADCCIILSDPSGMYSSYLSKLKVEIPKNVFIIKFTHSYFELLKEIDVMLRITTTDGDSISVREALFLQKIVIASNVVDRPAGVVCVSISREEIIAKLGEVLSGTVAPSTETIEHGGKQILGIFASLK